MKWGVNWRKERRPTEERGQGEIKSTKNVLKQHGESLFYIYFKLNIIYS